MQVPANGVTAAGKRCRSRGPGGQATSLARLLRRRVGKRRSLAALLASRLGLVMRKTRMMSQRGLQSRRGDREERLPFARPADRRHRHRHPAHLMTKKGCDLLSSNSNRS